MESSSSTWTAGPRSAAPTTCAVPGLRAGLAKLCSLSKVCAAPLLPDPDDDDEATSSKPGGVTGAGGRRYGYGGYDQRLLLARLFDTVGSLTAAYVRLQRAHAPYYDPARAAAADEAVASELDAAAALQRLCGVSGSGVGGVGALVNERWARVQGLEAEARRREAGVGRLRRELQRLRRDNSRLGKLVVEAAAASSAPELRGAAVAPAAVVEQFKAAAGSVRDFAELFAGLLASGGAEAEAAEQRPWERHSLEAHLWRALLGGGGGEQEEELELEQLGAYGGSFEGVMAPRDALDALMRFPRSGFARFCRRSYMRAVPAAAAAEAAAFRRGLDQWAFVARGGHPRTWFYRAFATAARQAWALRVLVARGARAGAGGARRRVFFYARGGTAFAAGYMESVGAAVGEQEEDDGEEGLCVAFTVTPGVKVGDAVVPARVLLCRRRRRRREGSGQVR